jgi:hypothetical protein
MEGSDAAAFRDKMQELLVAAFFDQMWKLAREPDRS